MIKIFFSGLEETCCELPMEETMCQGPKELKVASH